MKSTSTGRSMARDRSLMNMKAPLSTPTSSGGAPGVVGGDPVPELGDPGLEVSFGDDHPADVGRSLEGVGRRRPGAGHLFAVRDHRPDCIGAPCPAAPGPGSGAWPEPPVPPPHRPAARHLGRPAGSSGPPRAPGRRRRAGAGRDRHRSASPGRSRAHRLRAPRPGRRPPRDRPARPPPRGCRRPRRARRPGGPGRARRRVRRSPSTAGAARGGPGCGRSGGRRWTGRGPGPDPGAAHRATVSDRRSPSRGCLGPARMAARPSTPAPRSRLASTVSAWSSAVCPVAASGPRTAWRAARARASRLGPSAHRHPLGTERGTEPPGRRGHHAGLGRRPGPQAVVDVHRGHPAPGGDGQDQQAQRVGTARDTAHQGGPGVRECAPVEQGPDQGPAAGRSAGQGGRGTDTRDPFRRIADLSQRGQPLRTPPGPVEQLGAARPSTAAMNRSPSSYWRSLASMPMSCWSRRAGPRTCLRRRRSTSENLAALGDGRGPGPVHGHVAMPLEQAHQRLDPVQPLELLGGGHQAEGAVVAERIAPGPDLARSSGAGPRRTATGRVRANRSPPRPERRSSRASRGWR